MLTIWFAANSRMNKGLFLCSLIFLCSHFSQSQISIGFGLRSHFGGMQAFKDVKSFYNENRPWLDNEFSTGGLMNGFEIGLEYNKENFGLGMFHFYGVGSKTVAKGTNGSTDYRRMLKARFWGVDIFDFHWTPLHINNTNIGFGVMPLGMGNLRIKTQLNDEETFKTPFSELEALDLSIVKAFHIYAQVHADVTLTELKFGSLHLQVFRSFGPKQEYELFYLNKEINPTTYAGIYKRTYQKIDNWGLKLLLNIN